MTFDEWWKQMKPAECDELKEYFQELWVIAVESERVTILRLRELLRLVADEPNIDKARAMADAELLAL